MTRGRPLRFLMVVLAFWLAMRLTDAGQMRRSMSVTATVTAAVGRHGQTGQRHLIGRDPASPRSQHVTASASAVLVASDSSPTQDVPPSRMARGRTVRYCRAKVGSLPGPKWRAGPLPSFPVTSGEDRPSAATAEVAPSQTDAVPLIVTGYRLPAARPHRLGGGSWIVLRDGDRSDASTGQLGGSQAGVRITYGVDEAHRLAASARLSTPLAGRGAEAAIGLDWQPTLAPIHILTEERIALDGGRSGPMLGVVGGYGPAPVFHGLTVEAYGQAGGVARRGGGLFADGAVRASRRLAGIDRLALDGGIGAWGGAQPRLSRFDIGPTIGLTIGRGPRPLRLVADWRQRVAGRARPGSGPALSLAHDM